MPKIAYINKMFRNASLDIIDQADGIIREYRAKGFDLTLRQLYYQFVARNLLPNTERSYKNLGNLISDARLAGMIDWHAIIDRTRNLRGLTFSESPYDVIAEIEQQYHVDMWADQDWYPEVWIEKDALVGVITNTCLRNHVHYLACRGYTSQSEMWNGAVRMINAARSGRRPVVLYLGDHDPSGLDMSRDLEERLNLFGEHHDAVVRVQRLALNRDQIDTYGPPPNPTKLTDARAGGYVAEHGYESWELDALDPTVIDGLIQSALDRLVDEDRWEASSRRQAQGRELLADAKRLVQDRLS